MIDLQSEYVSGQIRKLSIYEGTEDQQLHFAVGTKIRTGGAELSPVSSIMERKEGQDRFYYIVVDKGGTGKIWKKIVNPRSPIITYEL